MKIWSYGGKKNDGLENLDDILKRNADPEYEEEEDGERYLTRGLIWHLLQNSHGALDADDEEQDSTSDDDDDDDDDAAGSMGEDEDLDD